MPRTLRWFGCGLVAAFAGIVLMAGSLLPGLPVAKADDGSGPVTFLVEDLDGSQFVYAVFHALDRDGFCQPPEGAVSLHPVLNLPVDFVIEAGDGVIIETSSSTGAYGRSAEGVPTFSTANNAATGSPVRAFPPWSRA